MIAFRRQHLNGYRGHLVETCTLLMLIITCSSDKLHEKGTHFTIVFKAEGQMVRGGLRQRPG